MPPPSTLQDRLDQITRTTRSLVPPERLARTEEVISALRATGIEKATLPVDGPAPAFRLPASSGKMVRSDDLLALGCLIVKFFRGRWCPYDITELETWQALLPEIRARHALLVAISPQSPRQNAFTAEQHGLQFPLLSDARAAVAAAYGLAYTVPEPTRPWYRSMLVNIPFLNGDDSWNLPLPGTFLLDQNAKILFAEANADHRLRVEPASILARL